MNDIISDIKEKLISKPDSFLTIGNALTWVNQLNMLLKEYVNNSRIQYRIFRKYFGENIEQIGVPIEIQSRLDQIIGLYNPTVNYKIKSKEDKVPKEGSIGGIEFVVQIPIVKYSVELVDSLDTILSVLDNVIECTLKNIIPPFVKPSASIQQVITELHQIVKYSSKSEDIVSYSHDICDILENNFNISVIEVKDPDNDIVVPEYFNLSSNPNIERSIMTIPAILRNDTGGVLCKGRIVLSDKQHI